MGLLDSFFGNADQTQALGLLGARMMSGDTARGFGEATGLLGSAPQREMQKQMMQMQMQNMQSEIEQRKAAVAKQQQIQDMMKGMFGSGGVSAPQISPGAFQPSADGMGPTLPPEMASQSRPGSRLANQSIDSIAALHAAGGPNLLDAYKWVKDPLKMEQGSTYRDRATEQERYMPKVGEGIAPDANGFYRDLPNYAQAQANIEGAKAGAVERAKSESDLVQVSQPDGSTKFVPRSQVVQAAQPQPLRTSPPGARPPAPTGKFEGDPQVVQAAINDIKNPQERAQAQQAYEQQYGPLQATPTSAQAAGAAAQKVTAEQRAKDVADQRRNIMVSDMAASGNIAKYQQIGKLLQDVDGGALTPTGTHLASLANSIGLKIDKSLPNKEAAASLANEAALQLRSPAGGAGMPGAMSDQDRQFLASMTPNMSQSAQGRKQVIDAYVATQRRNQQVATFARNYEKKYGQIDNGFFDQMQAWSNSNPLFGGK